MVFRPGEEGGYGLMDAFPTEQREEKENCLPVSVLGSFNISGGQLRKEMY